MRFTTLTTSYGRELANPAYVHFSFPEIGSLSSNSAGDGMYGLKRVSQRRDDALSRVGWAQLETFLATYYRGRGYQVDHVGTGANGTRFDGGIDLKLRRDSEYILVQCKHWNAMKVTHNAVHELLGIMAIKAPRAPSLLPVGNSPRPPLRQARGKATSS